MRCCHPSRRLLRKLLRMRPEIHSRPLRMRTEISSRTLSAAHPTIHLQLSNSVRAMRPHPRGAMRPSFVSIVTLKEKEGAGKAGCALHPRSRVHKRAKKTHTSIQVQRRQSGFPCAMGYSLFRALLGDRAFLPPSPAKHFASRELDASVGAPGPHGFAVRDACARQSQAARPPHPTARS